MTGTGGHTSLPTKRCREVENSHGHPPTQSVPRMRYHTKAPPARDELNKAEQLQQLKEPKKGRTRKAKTSSENPNKLHHPPASFVQVPLLAQVQQLGNNVQANRLAKAHNHANGQVKMGKEEQPALGTTSESKASQSHTKGPHPPIQPTPNP